MIIIVEKSSKFHGYVSCGHKRSKTVIITLSSGVGDDETPRVIRLNFCASCWTMFKKGMELAAPLGSAQVNLSYEEVSAI